MAAAAAVAMGVGSAPSAVAQVEVASSVAPVETVPLVRTFTYAVPNKGVEVAGAIHQVTRVPQGTLVVWSLGPRGKNASMPTTVRLGGDFNDGVSSVGPYLAKLADPASKLVLKPLALDKQCLCSDFRDRKGGDVTADHLVVLYAVFPALPESTTTVDLDLGGVGSFVAGVPVTKDSPLGPAATEAIPDLGTGWPTYPSDSEITAAIAQDDPKAVWDMTLHSGRSDASARVTDGRQRSTVDLAADVLFAFDSADLTEKATAGLVLAADKVKAAKATTVTITGYTDNTGDNAYNLGLSERRAQSVTSALTSLLPGLTLTAVGKGEADPVATNDSPEGQALNRRVSISFEGGK